MAICNSILYFCIFSFMLMPNLRKGHFLRIFFITFYKLSRLLPTATVLSYWSNRDVWISLYLNVFVRTNKLFSQTIVRHQSSVGVFETMFELFLASLAHRLSVFTMSVTVTATSSVTWLFWSFSFMKELLFGMWCLHDLTASFIPLYDTVEHNLLVAQ